MYSSSLHEVCSPAYQRFRDNLDDLITVDDGSVRFKVVKLDTDFPSCFEYQRVKELVSGFENVHFIGEDFNH